MAEQKRHMDVPQERFLGASPHTPDHHKRKARCGPGSSTEATGVRLTPPQRE